MDEQPSTTFAERLKHALGLVPRELLARELGVSVQAISQVLNGSTRAMTAANTALAAKFLGVSWFWLATGEGSPTAVDATPEEEDILGALREIRRINPETHAKLVRGIDEIAHGLRATDELLRSAHGVTGYVSPERAAATLPAPSAPRPDASRPSDNFMGGLSGFGDIDIEAPRTAKRK